MPRQKSIEFRIACDAARASRSAPGACERSAPGVVRGALRRAARRLGAPAAALLALGCASYQELNVASNPSEAEVFLDQRPLGKTPLRVRVERTADHALYVKKDGYSPELVVLTLRSARDGRKFLTPADVFVDLRRGRNDGPTAEEGLPERSTPGLGQGRGEPAAPGQGSAPAGAPGERGRDVQIDPSRQRERPSNR
jgi:hypothetical protein